LYKKEGKDLLEVEWCIETKRLFTCKNINEIGRGILKSKRASFDAGPLLTNPLNSCTKLQISAT